MSKTIVSPSKVFAGTVVLLDPMPFPLVLEFEQVIRDRQASPGQDLSRLILPVLIKAVEEWHLTGITPPVTYETFPGTPRQASSKLIAWLINEVGVIYRGNADDDPNA